MKLLKKLKIILKILIKIKIKKIKENIDNIQNHEYFNVKEDNNCLYRIFSLKIFNNQNKSKIIKQHPHNYIKIKIIKINLMNII